LIDATCPLVTKVHWEAQKFANEGFKIFYIGQRNHQEAIGVTDVAPMTLVETEADIEALEPVDADTPAVVLTQTTLSVDDTQALVAKLKQKVPQLRDPGDLCYATQNRQDAVKVLAKKCDFVIVIGSTNSSNSTKLVVTSKKYGADAALYDQAGDIPAEVFENANLGLTSGASVPDRLTLAVIERAKSLNPKVVTEVVLTKDESGLSFPLPPELR